MTSRMIRPLPHPNPEVNETHGYITCVVSALAARGVSVQDSWLDPMGPIDATIVTESCALVWDEWAGWVRGTYVSGHQGERTVLRDAVPLGGGVLLGADELARLVQNGTVTTVVKPRSAGARDGLFEALRRR